MKPIEAQVVKEVRPPERPGLIAYAVLKFDERRDFAPLWRVYDYLVDGEKEATHDVIRIPSAAECKLREERAGLANAVVVAARTLMETAPSIWGVQIDVLRNYVAALDAFDAAHPEIAGGGA